MRPFKTVEGECYHIYNRGVNKQVIFHDERDWHRFLFLITHFQSPQTFPNISYDLANFQKLINLPTTGHSVSPSKEYLDKIGEVVKERTVSLLAFALMPNHFHLLVREEEENGIPNYLQRIQNSQTKYSHAKYQTSGHILQGPYQIVHIEDNDQLLHISAYIHRNCRELKGWKDQEYKYPWSSLQDYIGQNRFEKLLCQELILEQFDDQKEYRKFVATSSAKDFEDIETFND